MKNIKILFLGKPLSPVFKWLEKRGEDIIQTDGIINKDFIINNKINFLISYGYKHILKKNIINLFKNRAINLHISYLPYNRGADPNLWSFIENTTKGVSIHIINEGVDTGEIIVQKEVVFKNIEKQTLHSTYEILENEIQSLFFENWHLIKRNKIKSSPQKGKGSYHNMKDRSKYNFLLEKDGWNTKVVDLTKL